MRKRFLAPFVISALFFAACGGGQDKTNSEQQASNGASQEAPVDSSMVSPGANAPVPKGKALIDDQDCKTCHKEDTKLVGPGYKEIAAKYPASDETIETLADKIIKGGSGNWGEVAMLPHPSLPRDDAKEMAKYIMSLK